MIKKSLAEQHAVFQLAQQPVPSLCPRDIINGTTGYLHSGYEVRSTTEATFFAPIWENIARHTLGPSVTGFDYNETTNILGFT